MRSLKTARTRVTTENPELADRFDRVLTETVQVMEESGIRYAFIGGIASCGLGRPRSTHDIDLFVRPEDAEIALRALAKHGFRTERTDPSWLYKGFKDEILVDIIFRSKGEIYFDQEMYQKMAIAEYRGKQLRLIGPEDLLIIKAVAHSELTPGHWHDAIGLLTHANLDWAYLLRRARRAPRRILSLLLYAQSNDIWVPNPVIDDLYMVIFGGAGAEPRQKLQREVLPPSAPQTFPFFVVRKAEGRPGAILQYGLAHLRERIAEDFKTNELDVQLEVEGNRLLIRGSVTVVERRKAVEDLAHQTFPGFVIDNQIRVVECEEPSEMEKIK